MILESFIQTQARELGFVAVGMTPVSEAQSFDRFQEWLRLGYAAGMEWLARQPERRAHPRSVAPQAQSVIVVAARYQPDPSASCIAAYARGLDYHEVIRARLMRLAEALVPFMGRPVYTRVCVDSAPVLEREWACRAGLGWLGRNGCLVNPAWGCCLLLGELFVDLPLAPSAPMANQCGDCRLCLSSFRNPLGDR